MLATRMMMAASGAAGGAANWWEAGGASGAVAAYASIGAASLAASYTNLANPGTNDAAPGVAPTWDTANGWIFNGSTQYLTTGITPVNNQQWSVLLRYSNYSGVTSFLLGANEAGGDPRFYLGRSSGNQNYASGTQVTPAVASPASGVQAFAGASGYMDGAFVVTLPSSAGTATQQLFIGARNSGGPLNFATCNIQAVAIYSSPLTADQVAAVSTAMAAL